MQAILPLSVSEAVMRSFALPALLPLLAAGPAVGQALISLPLAADASVTPQDYACDDGTSIVVLYVNSDPDSLAQVRMRDGTRLFVNVLAGSGARYVSGPYDWCVKGGKATLADATSEGSPLTCRVTD